MFVKLKNLTSVYNYTPDIILDIGAHHGNWTESMMNIYPNSKYYLFEGIDYNELNRYDKNENVFIYKNTLLNDKETEVDWYQEKNTGDSLFKELTHIFKNTKPIKRKTTTLDTIINRDNILKNDGNIFMKIDCQGAEIPILKGSKAILNKTDFIVLEMPLFGKYNECTPNFSEHIRFMDSIGFCPFDIIDNHYINNFNMQIDMLFINKKSNVYLNFKNEARIHSILLSSFERNHVINYIKRKKIENPNFKVIDIGGSAEYTNWSHSVIDYIVDINKPKINNKNIKYFALNINYETQWEELFNFVKINGKFDFCICSHIIEDIALPQVLLNNIKHISNEGFIGIPSKYRELSKLEGNFIGYIHHRWIYSIKNNKLLGFPKMNFIDHQEELINIGNPSNDILDLSFFWKNSVPYSIINNDYLGPTSTHVKEYYNDLLIDDIDTLNGENLYHMEHVRSVNKITGNFILIIVLMDNLVNDLEYMDNQGYIPYNIQEKNTIFGKCEFHILFINKNHEFNQIVQDKLL